MKNNIDRYNGDSGNSKLDKVGVSRYLISLRNARAFASLKVSAYRLFLGSQIFEVMGMTILGMVRSLLAYRLTDSTAIIGIIAMFQAVPYLLVVLFGGAIADRIQKKYIMLVCEIGMATLSLVTAFTLVTGYLSAINESSWWVLAVGAVFQGIFMGIMGPSRMSLIPEYVGDERLLNATSLLSFGTSAMRLIMPTAVGFLVDSFDFQAAFFAMTAVYFIASIFIYRFPLSSKAISQSGKTITAIKDGISYVRKEHTILFILAISLATGLLSMPYQQLLAVFADDVLNVGASGLGILMSLSGAGSVAGAILLASLPNKKRGLMLIVSILISGISLMAFSASTSWPLSLAIIVFVGMGNIGRVALGSTLIQYYVESEYRGRIMSILQMEMGLTSFGTFLAGVLAESIGVQWAIGGFAAVLALISVLYLAMVPQVRRLD